MWEYEDECFEDPKAVNEYFSTQIGHGMNVYAGVPRQRGYGLGSILSRGLSMATPLLKKGATHVGKSLLNTGLNVAADVLDGRNIKSAASDRLKETGVNLLSDTVSYLAPKPPRKAVKRKKSTSSKKSSKRTRSTQDIFG